MQNSQGEIRIHLNGPLRAVDDLGKNYTPRGQKACGLLALLALAPQNRRSRKWIQDKLWSDRGEEQGAASLRQTLTEIRRTFGDYRDCILTDRTMIALDKNRVSVERLEDIKFDKFQRDVEILEGLEIRDPEFEHWLRNQRLQFSELIQEHENNNPVDVGPLSSQSEEYPKASLILLRNSSEISNHNSVRADSMSDTIARLAAESGMVDVIDWRALSDPKPQLPPPSENRNTLAIKTDFSESFDGAVYRVLLFDPITNQMIWSTSIGALDSTFENIEKYLADPNLLRSLNIAASVVAEELHRQGQDQKASAQRLCFQGIQHLYRLGDENFDIADSLFAKAYEMNQRGIYLAWRAYLRTFLIAERKCESEQVTSEEAIQFASKALESDPHNSFVLSLCAHVYAITQSSFVAAYELATQSIENNPANPLGWICLAVAESQIGDVKKAFNFAQRARKIAGTSPFRYHIDALTCIVGVLSGDLAEAEYYGEASHALAPGFAAPMRFLTGLYFHNHKYELAENMLVKLNELEPDFSLELLHDHSYPAESLRRSVLIDSVPKRI